MVLRSPKRSRLPSVVEKRQEAVAVCDAALLLMSLGAVQPENQRHPGVKVEPALNLSWSKVWQFAQFLANAEVKEGKEPLPDSETAKKTLKTLTNENAVKRFWFNLDGMHNDLVRYLYRPSVFCRTLDEWMERSLGTFRLEYRNAPRLATPAQLLEWLNRHSAHDRPVGNLLADEFHPYAVWEAIDIMCNELVMLLESDKLFRLGMAVGLSAAGDATVSDAFRLVQDRLRQSWELFLQQILLNFGIDIQSLEHRDENLRELIMSDLADLAHTLNTLVTFDAIYPSNEVRSAADFFGMYRTVTQNYSLSVHGFLRSIVGAA